MRLCIQLDVINGGARALRYTSHRGGLRQIAVVRGQVHDPIDQHTAALPAHGQNGNGDGARRVTA